MENASKALLIAGGVLITMIVASFGVYLYGVYHEHSENMLAAMSEKEMSQFNAKFLIYEDRKLNANEVISILNLVRNNNIEKEGEEYQIVTKLNHQGIVTGGVSQITDFLSFESIIKNSSEEDYKKACNDFIYKYSVERDNYYFIFKVVSYSEITGLVKEISINIHQ